MADSRWTWAFFRRVLTELAISCLGILLIICAVRASEAWVLRHFLPEWRNPWNEVMQAILVARIGAAALGVFLLLAARPWLGRFVEARSLKALALDAGPTVIAAVLAVGAAELVLRETMLRIYEAKAEAHEPRRVDDPVLGFDFVAGHTGYGQEGGRRIQYAFDANGLRVRRPGDQVDLSRPTIVFVGESIMCGYGLPWEDSIPALVQARTGLASADVAVEGYGVDQAYLRLRRKWDRIRRPVAVVSLLLPTAISRVLDDRRPVLGPGLVWRPAHPEWMLVHVLRRRISYRTEAEIASAVAVNRQALQATAAMAHARGATALVVVPVLTPEPAAERALRERVLKGSGLDYVLAPVDRSWRIAGDRHPDARGARVIAQAISAWLIAHDPRIAAAAQAAAR
jgi:hypothetical protein